MIIQETSDNVQGFKSLGTRLTNLRAILLKMEIEGTSADRVSFLEKLEVCVSDIH